ncbi:hypothetical protein [Rubrivivax gelatinosus]|uniref:hypothetical protein n=1 Tax=Rubrivivax gelatinosus TaxID=28068 RepID=UPI0002F21D80|nr:hypothetical protein [Rubrivivax gelatinosus]MBG6083049.1 hypothetical protein [Rubrivivax gelatinosus]
MTNEVISDCKTDGSCNAALNDRGNSVLSNEAVDAVFGFIRGCADAYARRLLPRGWQAYKTLHDNSQFGIWVHVGELAIMTYDNVDRTLVQCADEDAFQAELQTLAEFFGYAPLDFSEINPLASATV